MKSKPHVLYYDLRHGACRKDRFISGVWLNVADRCGGIGV
jgi:hypothetical protein